MNPERTYYCLINEPEVVAEVTFQESRDNDPIKVFKAMTATMTNREAFEMLYAFQWLKEKARQGRAEDAA